jgi:hypothetical protein
MILIMVKHFPSSIQTEKFGEVVVQFLWAKKNPRLHTLLGFIT